ncbi:rab-like protein 3 isoform X2 [Cherax quadricarinatus]|uniref:rab-like protein 3 isoform X2 n=1 Tax=Cherax quadricarinatus TaxID=27406 RepID=UPI0023797D10|nr:rab-like protein 3 isoform X2 [Cherax quadricarinatus]XP_053638088.1 rab-like protein 3 isoform X2 [Cherax quadricarinatus]XP_053638089.1 rab-like protein 3 isoform X2 [Cherax quadricarinatus]XP_053638090.1 rab-like protein 3 isoform X2 [Cherax quadricarinatus]
MANHANAMNKVKILVVGDSGVGKSSLVHLICHGQCLSNSSWTIGCSVEVRVHEYREGTPSQRPYFVELWDVGGSNSHKNARHVFYNPVHGIILVHDLTNRKSQQNLRRWLSEILLREGGGTKSRIPLVDDFDAEQFGGFSQVYGMKKLPVFVVGTKQEQVAEFRTSGRVRSSSIADECAADEITVNTLDQRSLAPGSSNAVRLSRFFDKVIERQQTTTSRTDGGFSYLERENPMFRRNKATSSFVVTG